VGAKLIQADGQTDRLADTTKLTVAFSNFANAAPKIFLSILFSSGPMKCN